MVVKIKPWMKFCFLLLPLVSFSFFFIAACLLFWVTVVKAKSNSKVSCLFQGHIYKQVITFSQMNNLELPVSHTLHAMRWMLQLIKISKSAWQNNGNTIMLNCREYRLVFLLPHMSDIIWIKLSLILVSLDRSQELVPVTHIGSLFALCKLFVGFFLCIIYRRGFLLGRQPRNQFERLIV